MKRIVPLIAISVLIFGCSSVAVYKESFPVMGTVAEIKIVSSDRAEAESAISGVKELIRKIESDLSYYDPASRLSRINKRAPYGFVKLAEDESVLIRKAIQMSSLTDGAFDITFYPIWEEWKTAEKKGRLPSKKEITSAKNKTGCKNIILSDDGRRIKFSSKDIKINLGGTAKEYALEKCAELLKDIGINNALVSLGGDIVAIGNGSGGGWKVGIQDPFDPEKITRTVTVKDKLILTSGIYQRYVEIGGKRYHHIIDVRTGQPAGDFASVTIIKDIGSTIPISSIAVFLMGEERAMEYLGEHPSIGYFIIEEDGRILAKGP